MTAAAVGQPTIGRIAAVVLNFRTPVLSLAALQSLAASDRPPDQRILVDNAAPPEKAPWWRHLDPPVDYIASGENRGFAGGMNLGIARALGDGADAVLLVNSDAIVEPGCLGALEHTMAVVPSCAIAGPVLWSTAAAPRVVSCGIGFHAPTGRLYDRAGRRGLASIRREPPHVVDAVSGCVMLVHRRTFDAIGWFDEPYFFGFEDVDLCMRASRAGLRTWLVPGAAATHVGSASLTVDPTRRWYYAARNHQRLIERTAPGGPIARALRFGFVTALNGAHAATSGGGSLAGRVRATWAGTRDHLVGRYGDGTRPATVPGPR